MDTFDTLLRTLESALGISEKFEQKLALTHYRAVFPHAEIKKRLSEVPVVFHRQWIRASIRGHLREIQKMERAAIKGDGTEILVLGIQAKLWLGQAKKIYETVRFFKEVTDENFDAFHLSPHNLEKGDVVLSYKTSTFLRRSPLSLLVRLATNSPITHSLIACHHPSEEPKLLVSGDTSEGLGVQDPTPIPGEIFLVLRPKECSSRIQTQIDNFARTARARLNSMIDYKAHAFPELKCQTASLIGLATTCAGFLGQPLTVSNPFRSRPGKFCSELIDDIFLDAGVTLTPRSKNRATVGPVEFLYSPYLTFVGYMCTPGDRKNLAGEVRKQFLGA